MCLRRILRVSYWNYITNEEVLQRAESRRLHDIVAERRFRMAGHILRLPEERPAKTAMTWTPSEGRRGRVRPKETWRRTFYKDLARVDITWRNVQLLLLTGRAGDNSLLPNVPSRTAGTKSKSKMRNPPTDVDELFDCYNCIISNVLDRLAPFADIKQHGRTVSPWYDRECYVTKLKTSRLEKAYRRHPNTSALTFWRMEFNRQRSLYQNKFVSHWSVKINSSNGNGKALWAHVNCLLTRPKVTATTYSSNIFADHFTQKIRRIQHSAWGYSTPTISDRRADVPLATLRPMSADEVAALIKKSPAKQCPLDPLPTWLLKDICDTI